MADFLSLVRIPGGVLLLIFAGLERPGWMLVAYLAFAATDLLDGLLARWNDADSARGARLDTWGDLALNAALAAGIFWLRWVLVRPAAPVVAVAVGLYLVSGAISLARFGRWPIYHTWMAKCAWGLIIPAAVSALAGWAGWPLGLAAVFVALGNLEAIAISCCLEFPQANVRSLQRVLLNRAI